MATSGGHLTQLFAIAARIDGTTSAFWVSDDAQQSRSELETEDHLFVPRRPPRDYRGVMADARTLSRVFRSWQPEVVVSTGSQIALSAWFNAARRQIPFVYIESGTRVTGLSTTGRALNRLPGVRRYVQYPWLTNKRWGLGPSVLDLYDSEPNDLVLPKRGRMVVTVGGNAEYGFRRMIDAIEGVVPPGWEVIWQVGPTDMAGFPHKYRRDIPSSELLELQKAADLVACHAGTGSIVTALEAGKVPVVIPRSASHGEHIDDHQLDLARHAEAAGLAVVVKPDQQISIDVLEQARGRSVLRAVGKARIALADLAGVHVEGRE